MNSFLYTNFSSNNACKNLPNTSMKSFFFSREKSQLWVRKWYHFCMGFWGGNIFGTSCISNETSAGIDWYHISPQIQGHCCNSFGTPLFWRSQTIFMCCWESFFFNLYFGVFFWKRIFVVVLAGSFWKGEEWLALKDRTGWFLLNLFHPKPERCPKTSGWSEVICARV